MKINLLLGNPTDERNGYQNIDLVEFGLDRRGTIDTFVDDGEAEEVIVLDILDYFSGHDVDAVLKNWLKKLAHGATLTLSVVDIREVSRGILSGRLDLETAHELLYGKQEKPWQFKKCCFTLGQVVETLTNLGYKILTPRLQNMRAIVTCQRP